MTYPGVLTPVITEEAEDVMERRLQESFNVLNILSLALAMFNICWIVLILFLIDMCPNE